MAQFSGVRTSHHHHINEDHLYHVLSVAFQGNQVLQNVKRSTNIKYPSTGMLMEFDVWIPAYQLCFEFQDSHHYTTTYYYQNTQGNIQHHDYMKETLAHQHQFTLVPVPCWWSGDLRELASSICFYRPDLASVLQPLVSPINLNPLNPLPVNLNPLPNYFKDSLIPGVGELMLASYPPHFKFSILDSRSIWWVGEKYDGIRCCWSPREATGYSRYGRKIPGIACFHDVFPTVFTDSELWFGRGQFLYTYTLIKGTPHKHWSYLRLVAFDVPVHYQNDIRRIRSKYEDRYHLLLDSVPYHSPFTIIATRSLCKHDIHMNHWVEDIIKDGGEGIILQKRESAYEQGRSTSIIKLKTTRDDQEGVVTRNSSDGHVTLKLPNGATMTVPPHNILLETPSESSPSIIRVGDVVSFSREMSSRQDTPGDQTVTIYRIRPDLSWDDVQSSFRTEDKIRANEGFKAHHKGHWTPKTMRRYLESFARDRGLDPLLASSWFNSAKELYRSKDASTILAKFKNGYYQALVTLFPEVHFDPSQFRSATDYSRIENRRRFFESYAKTHGFDALSPDNWYLQPTDRIMSKKGAARVMYYHKHSVPKALLELFPNIGLQPAKFQAIYQKFWATAENRRKFFEIYASDHSFNPTVPDNWYPLPRSDIMSVKGSISVMKHHNNSVIKALMDLFPDVQFDKTKFQSYHNFWSKPENHRKFLENYATKEGFNPKSSEDWHLRLKRLQTTPGIQKVLRYYGNDAFSALLQLFPGIGLERNIQSHRQSYWENINNRRRFFENYANEHGFDSQNAEHWYAQSRSKIKVVKGCRSVIKYHNNSVSRALIDLFPTIGIQPNLFQSHRT